MRSIESSKSSVHAIIGHMTPHTMHAVPCRAVPCRAAVLTALYGRRWWGAHRWVVVYIGVVYVHIHIHIYYISLVPEILYWFSTALRSKISKKSRMSKKYRTSKNILEFIVDSSGS